MSNNNRPGMINANEVAEEAARNALKKFRQEERDRKKKTRLYNTELLLRKYNDLKEHIQEAVSSYSEIVDPEFDKPAELDDFDVYIYSIGRCKFRSAVMLTHIDVCLKWLEYEHPDKYVIIDDFYFKGKSIEDIADSLHISIATAHRWKKEMVEILSVKLFGLEGLRLDF